MTRVMMVVMIGVIVLGLMYAGSATENKKTQEQMEQQQLEAAMQMYGMDMQEYNDLIIMIGALENGSKPEQMTKEEKNKLLVDVAIGALNEGDWKLMAKLYSTRFVLHSPGNLKPTTWTDYELACRIVKNTMPTARIEIEDMIAEGDKVAIRCKTVVSFKEAPIGRWTPDGRVELREMDLFRIEGGQIVEEWCEYDPAGWQKELKKLKYVETWK